MLQEMSTRGEKLFSLVKVAQRKTKKMSERERGRQRGIHTERTSASFDKKQKKTKK